MEKKLIIIGNGFDLFHGIKSSYWNFKEYLGQMGYYSFVNSLEKYIDSDELWSSFEYALGILDSDSLKEDNSCYMLGYGDDNWRDSAHHDYQMMIAEELKFAKDIPVYLEDWILSLNTHRQRKISSDVISSNNVFLNFNYTDTLEISYGINRQKILYIHGKARKYGQLVAGHGNRKMIAVSNQQLFATEEEQEVYYEYMMGMDVREQEAQEIIRNYFKSTYKDVDRIMKYYKEFFFNLKDIKAVYILGHSLADVDLPYFKIINDLLGPQVQWTVTYYEEEDIDFLWLQLMKAGVGLHQIHMCRMEQL